MKFAGAVIAVLSAVFLSRYCRRMAGPYNFKAAETVDPARVARYPGNPEGAPLGTDYKERLLRNATRLFEGQVLGAESIAVSPDGLKLVMLDKYGYAHWATSPNGRRGGYERYVLNKGTLYVGPGRPLGFEFVADDVLIVCDSVKGLIMVDLEARAISVLANADETGAPIFYANDMEIHGDEVYFTSSTNVPVVYRNGWYDTMGGYLYNLISGAAEGRLFVYNLATQKTKTLLSGLSYANGVAVAEDGSFVLVVETDSSRVLRLWLRGPKKGETDVFASMLPGLPDGISRAPDGNFWIALCGKATPWPARLAPWPVLRTFISHVVVDVFPYIMKPFGGCLKFHKDGSQIDALFDPDGRNLYTISAVRELDGYLFFGNLAGNFVSVLKYP